MDEAQPSRSTHTLALTSAFAFGFLFLGFLIGTLVAMSAQSLSNGVIAAVFALTGGSLLALLKTLSDADQLKAAAGIGGISLGAILGVYSGLYVNDHRLLSPKAQLANVQQQAGQQVINTTSQEGGKYLRSVNLTRVNEIDQEYRTGVLQLDQAYEQLREEASGDAHPPTR